MPTLREFENKKTTTVILAGGSGNGKSVFSGYAPLPHAILCIDKDTPTVVPGVDSSQRFYKPYPPADCAIETSEYLRPRNVADHFLKDIQAFKSHIINKIKGVNKPLLMTMMDGKTEEWPTPSTIIVEGAGMVADAVMNQILTINGKQAVHQFVAPGMERASGQVAYGFRLSRLQDAYGMLLRLPVNIVVSTWIKEDMIQDEKGRPIGTGVWRPNFGGRLNIDAPTWFETSLMLEVVAGQYQARTRDNNTFKGFKVGNVFGLKETIPLTITKEVNPCRDLWTKLLAPPDVDLKSDVKS